MTNSIREFYLRGGRSLARVQAREPVCRNAPLPNGRVKTAAGTASIILLVAVRVRAGSLELSCDAAAGGPGRFAAAKIRRESLARGMTLGGGTTSTRVALTGVNEGRAVAESYRIRARTDLLFIFNDSSGPLRLI